MRSTEGITKLKKQEQKTDGVKEAARRDSQKQGDKVEEIANS